MNARTAITVGAMLVASVALAQRVLPSSTAPRAGDLPPSAALAASNRFLDRLGVPSAGTRASSRVDPPTAQYTEVRHEGLWDVQDRGFEVYVDAGSGRAVMASNGDWEYRHRSLAAQRRPRPAPAPILDAAATRRGLERRLRALIAPHEYRSHPMTVHDDTLSVGLDRLFNGLPILDRPCLASLSVDRATGEIVFFSQRLESPDPEPSVRRIAEAQARETAHRRLPRAMAAHPKETVVLGYVTPRGGARPRLAWRVHESYAIQGMGEEVSVLVDAQTGTIMDVIV